MPSRCPGPTARRSQGPPRATFQQNQSDRSPHYMTSSIEAATTPATPQVAVNDVGSEEAFLAAIDETIKYFNDGDIVSGVIVKVDRDEVLLDIGYKTEGVIPSRELSIKHDIDPNEVVSVGDEVEALVLQKEDKEGRLILSKKRAQYERAWGTIEAKKEADEVLTKLAKGQVRTGVVSSIVNFGAFVDLGGVDGLVHVSELSWKHIDHPSEVVEVGQEVT